MPQAREKAGPESRAWETLSSVGFAFSLACACLKDRRQIQMGHSDASNDVKRGRD